MDAQEQIRLLDALKPWETLCIRDTDIPFNDATASLCGDSPIIEAKRVSPKKSSKWTLNRTQSNQIATMVYTGLWSWGSNMETGNYVPPGEIAPHGVSDDRIQTKPSYKCEISFGFDTSVDDSLWKNMRLIEDHMKALPDFNIGGKPRRSWQDGTDPTVMEKYIVSSKLFLRATNPDKNAQLPDNIHPWILQATEEDTKHIPNPDIPRCYQLVGRTAVKLQDTNEPYFRKNDIVRMTFVIHINLGMDYWHPEIVPIELMRVGTFARGGAVPAKPPTHFPSVIKQFQHIEPGNELQFFEAPRCDKRKTTDSDEEREETIHSFKRPTTTESFRIDAMDEDVPEESLRPKLRISIKGKEKASKSAKA